MTNVTLGEIKTAMYGLMNDTSNNTTYTSNDRDTDKINDVVERVCSGFVQSLLDPNTVYKCSDLTFLRGKQYLQYLEPIVPTADVTIGALTILCDTTNASLTGGALYVGGQVISYTSKNAIQLTGVTGVVVPVDTGTSMFPVTKFNADVDKTYRLFHIVDNQEMPVFEVERQDDRFERQLYRGYTILFDEASGDRFVMIQGYTYDDKFLLKYYKVVADMVNDTDECIIPGKYPKTLVAQLAAGEMMMETESETAERQNKLGLGYNKLLHFYNKYSDKTKDLQRKMNIAPMNYNSMGGGGYRTGNTRTGFKIY